MSLTASTHIQHNTYTYYIRVYMYLVTEVEVTVDSVNGTPLDHHLSLGNILIRLERVSARLLFRWRIRQRMQTLHIIHVCLDVWCTEFVAEGSRDRNKYIRHWTQMVKEKEKEKSNEKKWAGLGDWPPFPPRVTLKLVLASTLVILVGAHNTYNTYERGAEWECELLDNNNH